MTDNCEIETEKEVETSAGQNVNGADKQPEVQDENVEELKNKDNQDVADNKQETSAEDKKEQEDSEDYKSKYFYLAAEFDNSLKRFEREREKFVKYGNEKILKALLDVMDNLDRTVQSIAGEDDEKIKNIHKGIEMVQQQFMKVLTENGLEKIESLGKKFDPTHHEAMAQQPAEGKEDDEVVQVYQDGYKLNGRLLRAAKVIIAKNN